jgi:beta-galactosidase
VGNLKSRNGLEKFLSVAGLLLVVFVFAGSLGAQTVAAQAEHSYVIDATAPVSEPGPGQYVEGTHVAPNGASIEVNSRYLIRDGKPWLPVMGEIHYTRVPEQEWEEEILKMKAGGVQIIATYVIWIHHEEVEGEFDWTGRRDLRRFVELCGNHGMLVQLRIGPWVHGETRNGGLPDWLMKKVPAKEQRTNAAAFMDPVQKFYAQVAQQVKGQLWKDGGPILGIQIENEYSDRSLHGGEEYILALKALAIRSGLDVPLYVITGWDNAVVPKGAVLPVYGGYPDAPWDASIQQLPANEVYLFRFGSRVSGNMGAIGGTGATPAEKVGEDSPFITAEIGGGMQDTYHRRPVISADDIAAICPVMLGSGVNAYGTYMFQGGQNPEGKLSTLQESQATGYPNDLPVKSYDFQAPLGEFGQERESFRKLKVFNYFLNDFGDLLAPLEARAPTERPSGPADFSVPRFSARTNGGTGFVFWNNHVRNNTMPQWAGVQLTVKLPHEELKIPRRAINVPSGAYFVWPFNLDMGGVMLKYSTAQLFTKLTSGKTITYFFVAIPGIAPQFALQESSAGNISIKSGSSSMESGVRYISGMVPGMDAAINMTSKSGGMVRIVLLSQERAESAWKAEMGGTEHLVFTSQQFYSDASHLYFQSVGSGRFSFQVTPKMMKTPQGTAPVVSGKTMGNVSSFSTSVRGEPLAVSFRQVREASVVPPVASGPAFSWRKNTVALAPTEDAFHQAAEWKITVPKHFPESRGEVFLDVSYVGDIARLSSGGKLLEDDFYNGLPWRIGLKRFAGELAADSLRLEILPLRQDAPIYLEKKYWPVFPKSGQVDELRTLKLVPEYQLTVDSRIP